MENKTPTSQVSGDSETKLGTITIKQVFFDINCLFNCEWCHNEFSEILVLNINEKNRYYCLDCLRNHLIYF